MFSKYAIEGSFPDNTNVVVVEVDGYRGNTITSLPLSYAVCDAFQITPARLINPGNYLILFHVKIYMIGLFI